MLWERSPTFTSDLDKHRRADPRPATHFPTDYTKVKWTGNPTFLYSRPGISNTAGWLSDLQALDHGKATDLTGYSEIRDSPLLG